MRLRVDSPFSSRAQNECIMLGETMPSPVAPAELSRASRTSEDSWLESEAFCDKCLRSAADCFRSDQYGSVLKRAHSTSIARTRLENARRRFAAINASWRVVRITILFILTMTPSTPPGRGDLIYSRKLQTMHEDRVKNQTKERTMITIYDKSDLTNLALIF